MIWEETLPSGWQTITLGKVAEVTHGRALPTHARRQHGAVPVYSSAGCIDRHDQSLHPGPAVIVGRKGTVGSVHYVAEPFWCIDTAFYIGHVSPAVDAEFLAHSLRALELARLASGAGVPGLRREALERQRLALPPLDEQRQIIRILNAADSFQTRTTEINGLARDVPASLFLHFFGDPGENPRGWERVGLEELLSPEGGMQTGPFGNVLRKSEYAESGIPVLGIENVGENEFRPTPLLYVSPRKFRDLKAFTVRDGDVLVSRAGTAGRMAVARVGDGESIIGTNLIRVSLRHDRVVPEYFTTLATSFGESVGELRATGSGYTFTRPSLLKRITLPLPPLELQERFLDALVGFQAYRGRRRAMLDEAGALWASLRANAFTGRLTAIWREGASARDTGEHATQELIPLSPGRAEAPADTFLSPTALRHALLDALGPDQRLLLDWIEQNPGYLTAETASGAEPLRQTGLTPARVRHTLMLLEQTGLVQRVAVPQRIVDREVDRFVPAYRRLLEDRDTDEDPLGEAIP